MLSGRWCKGYVSQCQQPKALQRTLPRPHPRRHTHYISRPPPSPSGEDTHPIARGRCAPAAHRVMRLVRAACAHRQPRLPRRLALHQLRVAHGRPAAAAGLTRLPRVRTVRRHGIMRLRGIGCRWFGGLGMGEDGLVPVRGGVCCGPCAAFGALRSSPTRCHPRSPQVDSVARRCSTRPARPPPPVNRAPAYPSSADVRHARRHDRVFCSLHRLHRRVHVQRLWRGCQAHRHRLHKPAVETAAVDLQACARAVLRLRLPKQARSVRFKLAVRLLSCAPCALTG